MAKKDLDKEEKVPEWKTMSRQKHIATKVCALTSHQADTIRVLPLFAAEKASSEISYYRVNIMKQIKENVILSNRIIDSYMIRYSAAGDEISIVKPETIKSTVPQDSQSASI